MLAIRTRSNVGLGNCSVKLSTGCKNTIFTSIILAHIFHTFAVKKWVLDLCGETFL
jgi:hypothetical protein